MKTNSNFVAEIHDLWKEEVRTGSEDHIMIVRSMSDDLWYMISAGEAHEISQLIIAIDEGDGRDYRLEYVYSDDMPEDANKLWSAMLICGDKIIIEDTQGLYSFGFDDPAPARGFLVKLFAEELGDLEFEFRNDESFALEESYAG